MKGDMAPNLLLSIKQLLEDAHSSRPARRKQFWNIRGEKSQTFFNGQIARQINVEGVARDNLNKKERFAAPPPILGQQQQQKKIHFPSPVSLWVFLSSFISWQRKLQKRGGSSLLPPWKSVCWLSLSDIAHTASERGEYFPWGKQQKGGRGGGREEA